METFKGVDGLTSAKRVIAMMMAVGMLVLSALAVYKDPSQAQNVLWPVGSVVAVALGATALERVQK